MGRYVNVFPVMDTQANSLAKIRKYLKSQKYESRGRDGKYVFARKATRFMQLTYVEDMVRLEAWVESANAEREEQGLMKQVEQIENILLCLEEDTAEEDMPRGMPEGVKVSMNTYLRKYAGAEFLGNLKLMGILGYVMIIPILISAVSRPIMFLDAAILLSLTLGMHLGRNKLCAFGIVLYALINCVLSLGSAGMMIGWGWVILGVFAVLQFRKEEKQYEKLMRQRRESEE